MITDLESWLGYSGSLVRDDSQLHDYAFVETSPSHSHCEDLEAVGSFNITCLLSSTRYLKCDINIHGVGNWSYSLMFTSIPCGCLITGNVFDTIKLVRNASMVVCYVILFADNLTMK